MQSVAGEAWWEARPVGRVMGMLTCVCEPSAPFQGAAVATGVCHAAFAMLWGTGTSQGAISAGKSEGMRQMVAGLCHVLQQQHRNTSML